MATTTFNDLITFSRGSNATVTGPNGLIQWAPNNPLTNSQEFEAAAWPKQNVTIVANATAAPDGTTTADLMYPTTTGTDRRIIRGTTLTTGVVYAQSLYVKAAGKRWAFLNGVDASGPANTCWFDLENGVVGTKGASVLSAGISPVGDGWYRIFTTGAAGANNYFFLMVVDGDNSLVSTTNGTDGIFIWGAQLELGSTATTYNNTSVRNLLGFSEASDNAAWTKIGTSIVTGAQANPVNGLFNAQKLMEDTANSGHQINQGATTTANPFTFSTYAKPAGRNWIALGITDSGSTVRISYFDLANGVTGTVASGVTASIVSVGNGWYRCAVTVAAAAAGANVLRIYATNANNNTTYTGDGNSGVYIYGAMLSNSASLDPYVPTPGAAPSSTAYYGPRFDYDPVTLLPRGLLVEEARTNSLTYSEQFDNAAWLKTDLTVTPNAAVSPDGTLNADTLVENTANSTHFIYRVSAGTAGTYTYSFYAKANGRTEVQIEQESGGNSRFTLSGAGTALALGANTVSITAVGNGWYRCVTTFTATGAFGVYNLLYNGARSYLGNGTSGVFFYGAQLEAGAFATSYIPTIASTVTRSADVATITGSLFSQWYRQEEGCLVVEASNPANGVLYILDVNNSTVNEEIRLATTSTSGSLVVWQAGAVQANITVGSMTANAPFKMAAGYAANNTNAALNGTVGTADTSFVSPTVSRLQIGASFTQYLNGHIRSIRYVPVRAADFQLQALTAPPELLSSNIYDRFNDLVLDRDGQTIEVR